MVAENVENIRQRIAHACARVGRQPDEIILIAVTKTFGTDMVQQAFAAGIRDFGENYVQELQRKRDSVAQESIRWHFIGHLQSNKVRNIAPWIHLIHAVDSLKVAEEISRRAAQANRRVGVLLEVNTTGEETKYGVRPEDALDRARELSRLPNVNLEGLMTMGPFLPDPEQSRPSFQSLADVREEIERDGIRLPHLSMGMTGDFEVAIEEGATMVRIGTGIFGHRIRKQQ